MIPKNIESFGFPITLVFSKDGRGFFSERITGNLWEVNGDKFRLIKHFSIVPITGHHETGLLGIALDPDFEENNYVYCFYTYGNDDTNIKSKVVRIKIGEEVEKIILDNIPASRIHNGGILAFAPDKTLYIGVGVSNEVKENAQDLNCLDGKILRINQDGTIPSDNPFSNSPIYSYGHRNIFGLAFHPKTEELYVCDVGPEKNDEINIISKGGNYGWPITTGKSNDSRFIDPIISYTPVITPTQCVFANGFLYFGSYNEGNVHKLTLGGKNFDEIMNDEIVYHGKPFGINGVFYSPDEKFYIATENSIKEMEKGS